MASASDLRKGMAVKIDGDLLVVTDRQHVAQGNKRSHIQTTLRSIRTGKVLTKRLRPSDAVEVAELDPRKVQFSYKDHHGWHFMDQEDFDTYTLSENIVAEAKDYLKEGAEVLAMFYEGNPIELELPANVVLKVVDTIPGVRGNSATNVQKPATLESGVKVDVPLFIDEGEEIRIDTRTGLYLGRA